MNPIISITLSLFATITTMVAQTTPPSSTVTIYSNHPTIGDVSVSYRTTKSPSVTPTASTSTVSVIYMLPEATITLKPNVTIAKAYLTILNKQDSSLLYQVNYMINSAPITNSLGKKLFFIENSKIHICSPNALPLNTYLYKLHTEDNQGNVSPDLIITK